MTDKKLYTIVQGKFNVIGENGDYVRLTRGQNVLLSDEEAAASKGYVLPVEVAEAKTEAEAAVKQAKYDADQAVADAQSKVAQVAKDQEANAKIAEAKDVAKPKGKGKGKAKDGETDEVKW